VRQCSLDGADTGGLFCFFSCWSWAAVIATAADITSSPSMVLDTAPEHSHTTDCTSYKCSSCYADLQTADRLMNVIAWISGIFDSDSGQLQHSNLCFLSVFCLSTVKYNNKIIQTNISCPDLYLYFK